MGLGLLPLALNKQIISILFNNYYFIQRRTAPARHRASRDLVLDGIFIVLRVGSIEFTMGLL